MKLKCLAVALLLTVASAAQALPQFQIHAVYDYRGHSQLDATLTFSSDYQQIVAAEGWFTELPGTQWATTSKVDTVSATYTFADYDKQYKLPSTLRGAWLQSSTSDALMPDISWDFATAPNPAFPVLVTASSPPNLDGGFLPWAFYNNSVNGSGRALELTVTPLKAAPVPEPETYAMLLAGIGVMAWMRRRQQRSDAVASA
ncbi:PEP-CTERM sorting domain-containing protein [Duganella sp. BJB488]|uniref:PEP-CTERM sorting domain-containing protein n=1 Tax=unclassified Duganella TaxID=2636909 RepID=UPI000E340672|nr:MULTISPECIES: PEP-CTERM sorting domain-containing protein [unclassified Duganella]NVD71276.1 PEP-CTERM sorting domain-containing protein [Duganella sp. BJB1802]RFP20491.1 PEP-CTERM sorting domain-containing protein [Duganella sp. BJB489]RFP21073.1 PEP-CTERM sorting domain-containing protein [Duganella sp. BJB488]RFP33209.1 PEP-CTERM sorting domain-containing protein [Duganella sp. BJB480]